MINLSTLIYQLPDALFANVFIIFLIFFYVYLFLNYKLFSAIFKTLRRNKLFLLIFIMMFIFSFINGWHSKLYYDEPENVINSLKIFRHLTLTDPILPRPLGFSTLLSFFNTDSYFYSQLLGRIISFLSTFFSAVLLFMIFRKFNVDKKLSYLFVFLFSIAPYNLFYLTLNKPESLAVFFLLFFIYLFQVYVFDKRKDLLWFLYFLSLVLPLTRYELIVVSFSFFLFILFKFKRKIFYWFPYLIIMFFIFLGSVIIFSGVNSIFKGPKIIRFDLLNFLHSFVIKMFRTPWFVFFILFFIFIFYSLKKSKGKTQKYFYLFIFVSFILLSLIYSAYDFSYEQRYQKLLYPFLFIGLSVIRIKNPNLNSKVLYSLIFVFGILFMIFSLNAYSSIKDINLKNVFTDSALIDIQKNRSCFSNAILYCPVYFPKALIEDLNFIKVYSAISSYQELESKYNEKYQNLTYLYLIEYFTDAIPGLIPKEVLSLRGSKENYDKLTKFCPGLSDETKSFLIYLDKPLSQYFKK
ncbi:MAG: hypothetical protein PWR32_297 [Candidatus Woesearchaeota archaeon]|nr:hypothetical protein [Candidatus Woesearchaeota archaeon]